MDMIWAFKDTTWVLIHVIWLLRIRLMHIWIRFWLLRIRP